CSLWCYWQTIFTESPNVPEQTDCEGRRRLGERYASEHNLPVQCRTGDQMYRICAICWLIKPDRAHHCRNELPESGKYIILMLFAVSFMFAMSLSGLLGYHIILIIHNTSTIESFQKPVFLAGTNNNGYDQGNIGNGFTYEVGIKLPVQLYTQSDQIYIGIETN
ncbi:unnamed protein product, partial [Oppiella nova]